MGAWCSRWVFEVKSNPVEVGKAIRFRGGKMVKFHRCLNDVIKGGVCGRFWHERRLLMEVFVCSFHVNWKAQEDEYRMEICGG